MNEELRPCPFCGNEPVVEGNLVACNNLNCPTHDNYWTDPMIFTCDQWNTRPIEDALHARIAELEAEIDEFLFASSNVLNPYDGISVPYEALKKLVKRVRKERERNENNDSPNLSVV